MSSNEWPLLDQTDSISIFLKLSDRILSGKLMTILVENLKYE